MIRKTALFCLLSLLSLSCLTGCQSGSKYTETENSSAAITSARPETSASASSLLEASAVSSGIPEASGSEEASLSSEDGASSSLPETESSFTPVSSGLADDGSITLTLPSSLFESEDGSALTQESLEKNAADGESYTLNDDGSVTVSYTNEARLNKLTEYKNSVDKNFNTFADASGDSYAASFLSIDYADDLSNINIYVDPDSYTDTDSYYAAVFVYCAYYYQLYLGTDPADISGTVNYIDDNTKDIIYTDCTDAYE